MKCFRIQYEHLVFLDKAKTQKITVVAVDHITAEDLKDAAHVAEIMAVSRSAVIQSISEWPTPSVKLYPDGERTQ